MPYNLGGLFIQVGLDITPVQQGFNQIENLALQSARNVQFQLNNILTHTTSRMLQSGSLGAAMRVGLSGIAQSVVSVVVESALSALMVGLTSRINLVKSVLGGFVGKLTEGLQAFAEEERSFKRTEFIFRTASGKDDPALNRSAQQAVVELATATSRSRAEVASAYYALAKSGANQEQIVGGTNLAKRQQGLLYSTIGLSEAVDEKDLTVVAKQLIEAKAVFKNIGFDEIANGLVGLANSTTVPFIRLKYFTQHAAPNSAAAGLDYTKDFIPVATQLLKTQTPEMAGISQRALTQFLTDIPAGTEGTIKNYDTVYRQINKNNKDKDLQSLGFYEMMTTPGQFLNGIGQLREATRAIVTNPQMNSAANIKEFNSYGKDTQDTYIDKYITDKLLRGNEQAKRGFQSLANLTAEERHELVRNSINYNTEDKEGRNATQAAIAVKNEGFKGAIDLIGSSLDNIWTYFGEKLSGGATAFVTFSKNVADGLFASIDKYAGSFERMGFKLTKSFNDSDIVDKVVDSLSSNISTLGNILESLLDRFLDWFAEGDGIANAVSKFNSLLVDSVDSFLSLYNVFKQLLPLVNDWASANLKQPVESSEASNAESQLARKLLLTNNLSTATEERRKAERALLMASVSRDPDIIQRAKERQQEATRNYQIADKKLQKFGEENPVDYETSRRHLFGNSRLTESYVIQKPAQVGNYVKIQDKVVNMGEGSTIKDGAVPLDKLYDLLRISPVRVSRADSVYEPDKRRHKDVRFWSGEIGTFNVGNLNGIGSNETKAQETLVKKAFSELSAKGLEQLGLSAPGSLVKYFRNNTTGQIVAKDGVQWRPLNPEETIISKNKEKNIAKDPTLAASTPWLTEGVASSHAGYKGLTDQEKTGEKVIPDTQSHKIGEEEANFLIKVLDIKQGKTREETLKRLGYALNSTKQESKIEYFEDKGVQKPQLRVFGTNEEKAERLNTRVKTVLENSLVPSSSAKDMNLAIDIVRKIAKRQFFSDSSASALDNLLSTDKVKGKGGNTAYLRAIKNAHDGNLEYKEIDTVGERPKRKGFAVSSDDAEKIAIANRASIGNDFINSEGVLNTSNRFTQELLLKSKYNKDVLRNKPMGKGTEFDALLQSLKKGDIDRSSIRDVLDNIGEDRRKITQGRAPDRLSPEDRKKADAYETRRKAIETAIGSGSNTNKDGTAETPDLQERRTRAVVDSWKALISVQTEYANNLQKTKDLENQLFLQRTAQFGRVNKYSETYNSIGSQAESQKTAIQNQLSNIEIRKAEIVEKSLKYKNAGIYDTERGKKIQQRVQEELRQVKKLELELERQLPKIDESAKLQRRNFIVDTQDKTNRAVDDTAASVAPNTTYVEYLERIRSTYLKSRDSVENLTNATNTLEKAYSNLTQTEKNSGRGKTLKSDIQYFKVQTQHIKEATSATIARAKEEYLLNEQYRLQEIRLRQNAYASKTYERSGALASGANTPAYGYVSGILGLQSESVQLTTSFTTDKATRKRELNEQYKERKEQEDANKNLRESTRPDQGKITGGEQALARINVGIAGLEELNRKAEENFNRDKQLILGKYQLQTVRGVKDYRDSIQSSYNQLAGTNSVTTASQQAVSLTNTFNETRANLKVWGRVFTEQLGKTTAPGLEAVRAWMQQELATTKRMLPYLEQMKNAAIARLKEAFYTEQRIGQLDAKVRILEGASQVSQVFTASSQQAGLPGLAASTGIWQSSVERKLQGNRDALAVENQKQVVAKKKAEYEGAETQYRVTPSAENLKMVRQLFIAFKNEENVLKSKESLRDFNSATAHVKPNEIFLENASQIKQQFMQLFGGLIGTTASGKFNLDVAEFKETKKVEIEKLRQNLDKLDEITKGRTNVLPQFLGEIKPQIAEMQKYISHLENVAKIQYEIKEIQFYTGLRTSENNAKTAYTETQVKQLEQTGEDYNLIDNNLGKGLIETLAIPLRSELNQLQAKAKIDGLNEQIKYNNKLIDQTDNTFSNQAQRDSLVHNTVIMQNQLKLEEKMLTIEQSRLPIRKELARLSVEAAWIESENKINKSMGVIKNAPKQILVNAYRTNAELAESEGTTGSKREADRLRYRADLIEAKFRNAEERANIAAELKINQKDIEKNTIALSGKTENDQIPIRQTITELKTKAVELSETDLRLQREYGNEMVAIQEKYKTLIDVVEDAKMRILNSTKDSISSFFDDLVEGAKSFTEIFDDFVDGFSKRLARVGFNLLMERWLEPLYRGKNQRVNQNVKTNTYEPDQVGKPNLTGQGSPDHSEEIRARQASENEQAKNRPDRIPELLNNLSLLMQRLNSTITKFALDAIKLQEKLANPAAIKAEADRIERNLTAQIPVDPNLKFGGNGLDISSALESVRGFGSITEVARKAMEEFVKIIQLFNSGKTTGGGNSQGSQVGGNTQGSAIGVTGNAQRTATTGKKPAGSGKPVINDTGNYHASQIGGDDARELQNWGGETPAKAPGKPQRSQGKPQGKPQGYQIGASNPVQRKPKNPENSTVKILNGDTWGSGHIARKKESGHIDQYTIATAGHVVSNVPIGGKVQVKLANGRIHAATVVKKDASIDLALLRLDTASELQVSEYSNRSLKPKDSLDIVGYPLAGLRGANARHRPGGVRRLNNNTGAVRYDATVQDRRFIVNKYIPNGVSATKVKIPTGSAEGSSGLSGATAFLDGENTPVAMFIASSGTSSGYLISGKQINDSIDSPTGGAQTGGIAKPSSVLNKPLKIPPSVKNPPRTTPKPPVARRVQQITSPPARRKQQTAIPPAQRRNQQIIRPPAQRPDPTRAVVQLFTGDFSGSDPLGSGVIFKEEKRGAINSYYIATSADSVNVEGQSISVRPRQGVGKPAAGTVVYRDPGNSVGIIRVDTRQRLPVAPLTRGGANLPPGTRTAVSGFAGDGRIAMRLPRGTRTGANGFATIPGAITRRGLTPVAGQGTTRLNYVQNLLGTSLPAGLGDSVDSFGGSLVYTPKDNKTLGILVSSAYTANERLEITRDRQFSNFARNRYPGVGKVIETPNFGAIGNEGFVLPSSVILDSFGKYQTSLRNPGARQRFNRSGGSVIGNTTGTYGGNAGNSLTLKKPAVLAVPRSGTRQIRTPRRQPTRRPLNTLINRIPGSIVRLQGNGSGTIMDNRRGLYTVATAAHVIYSKEEEKAKTPFQSVIGKPIKVLLHDGTEVEGFVSAIVPEQDYAVVSFRSNKNLPVTPFSSEKTELGAEYNAVGYSMTAVNAARDRRQGNPVTLPRNMVINRLGAGSMSVRALSNDALVPPVYGLGKTGQFMQRVYQTTLDDVKKETLGGASGGALFNIPAPGKADEAVGVLTSSYTTKPFEDRLTRRFVPQTLGNRINFVPGSVVTNHFTGYRRFLDAGVVPGEAKYKQRKAQEVARNRAKEEAAYRTQQEIMLRGSQRSLRNGRTNGRKGLGKPTIARSGKSLGFKQNKPLDNKLNLDSLIQVNATTPRIPNGLDFKVLGTGFPIEKEELGKEDGYIITTAAHVVAGTAVGQKVKLKVGNNQVLEGILVRKNEKYDTALIRVISATELPVLPLDGNSDKIQTNQPLIAPGFARMGNPKLALPVESGVLSKYPDNFRMLRDNTPNGSSIVNISGNFRGKNKEGNLTFSLPSQLTESEDYGIIHASGSPVLNPENNKVAGQLFATSSTRKHYEGEGVNNVVFTPSERIITELGEYHKERKATPLPNGTPPSDAYTQPLANDANKPGKIVLPSTGITPVIPGANPGATQQPKLNYDPNAGELRGGLKVNPAEITYNKSTEAAYRNAFAKMGLRIPVGSGVGMRKHPIYRDWRLHNGIDVNMGYGAPIFCPFYRAIAVTTPDPNPRKKEGNGNKIELVELDDQNQPTGRMAGCLHLSRFAVSNGAKVVHRQIVGYEGSTGGSTGSHMHIYQKRGVKLRKGRVVGGHVVTPSFEIVAAMATKKAKVSSGYTAIALNQAPSTSPPAVAQVPSAPTTPQQQLPVTPSDEPTLGNLPPVQEPTTPPAAQTPRQTPVQPSVPVAEIPPQDIPATLEPQKAQTTPRAEPSTNNQLPSAIASIARDNPDVGALGLLNLKTGQAYGTNLDKQVKTASTIKVALADLLLRRIKDKSTSLTLDTDLTSEVQHFGDGENKPQKKKVREWLSDMLRKSSNTAYNVLLDNLGGYLSVTQSAKLYGYSNKTTFGRLNVAKKFRQGASLSTPRDLLGAMGRIYQGKGEGYSIANAALENANYRVDNAEGNKVKIPEAIRDKGGWTSTHSGILNILEIPGATFASAVFNPRTGDDFDGKNRILLQKPVRQMARAIRVATEQSQATTPRTAPTPRPLPDNQPNSPALAKPERNAPPVERRLPVLPLAVPQPPTNAPTARPAPATPSQPTPGTTNPAGATSPADALLQPLEPTQTEPQRHPPQPQPQLPTWWGSQKFDLAPFQQGTLNLNNQKELDYMNNERVESGDYILPDNFMFGFTPTNRVNWNTPVASDSWLYPRASKPTPRRITNPPAAATPRRTPAPAPRNRPRPGQPGARPKPTGRGVITPNMERSDVLDIHSNDPEAIRKYGILTSTAPRDGKKHPQAHLNYADTTGKFIINAHHKYASEGKLGQQQGMRMVVLAQNVANTAGQVNLTGSSVHTSAKNDAPYGGRIGSPGAAVVSDFMRGVAQRNATTLNFKPGEIVILDNRKVAPDDTYSGRFTGSVEKGDIRYITLALPPNVKVTPQNAQQLINQYGRARGTSNEHIAPSPITAQDKVPPNFDKVPTVYSRKAGAYPSGESSANVGVPPLTGNTSYVIPINTTLNRSLGAATVDSSSGLNIYSDAARRTHGNYGREVTISVNLSNPTDDKIEATIFFESPNDVKNPKKKLAWVAPVKISWRNSKGTISTVIRDVKVYSGQKQQLLNLPLAPKTKNTVAVYMIVPADSVPGQLISVTSKVIKSNRTEPTPGGTTSPGTTGSAATLPDAHYPPNREDVNPGITGSPEEGRIGAVPGILPPRESTNTSPDVEFLAPGQTPSPDIAQPVTGGGTVTPVPSRPRDNEPLEPPKVEVEKLTPSDPKLLQKFDEPLKFDLLKVDRDPFTGEINVEGAAGGAATTTVEVTPELKPNSGNSYTLGIDVDANISGAINLPDYSGMIAGDKSGLEYDPSQGIEGFTPLDNITPSFPSFPTDLTGHSLGFADATLNSEEYGIAAPQAAAPGESFINKIGAFGLPLIMNLMNLMQGGELNFAELFFSLVPGLFKLFGGGGFAAALGGAGIPGFATGGVIGGIGDTDNQLILAMPGEGILSRKGMDNLGGEAVLHALNQGLPKFATGGIIKGGNAHEFSGNDTSRLPKFASGGVVIKGASLHEPITNHVDTSRLPKFATGGVIGVTPATVPTPAPSGVNAVGSTSTADANDAVRQEIESFMKDSAIAGGTESQIARNINVKYESVSIGGQNYVTEDQLRMATAQAANAGADIVWSQLRNSPSTRSSLGLG